MSFGISISDVLSLIQLTNAAIEGWKDACGRYASVTTDLIVLHTLLGRVQEEVNHPGSQFLRNATDARGWETLFKSCRSTVKKLEDIVHKRSSLGTNHKRNWDRIRMGYKNLDDLNTELVKRTTSLAAFVSVLGMSSGSRIENDLLPELTRKIDDLAALSRKGNGTVCTTWTKYDDDDKEVWREVRRDFRNSGFSGSVLHQHSAALKTYLARLQREGAFDEDGPISEEERSLKRSSKSSYPFIKAE